MRLSLQTQVLTALLLIMLIFAGILAINVIRFEQAQEDQQNVLIARAVSMRAADLARRAMLYETEAPRDFASYNRDLKLFYPSLNADLSGLSASIAELDGVQTHLENVSGLQELHSSFASGLAEKIGDVDEPRLEWAAEFLAEQAPPLKAAADSLEQTLQTQATDSLSSARELVKLSWLIGALVLLFTVSWFWLRVTRRIKNAAQSCQKVSEGDFGTTIADKSRDEIGDFAQAFNGLSSRTRVVLGVVDRVEKDATPEQVFQTVWEESHSYLGHQWQGMFALDSTLSIGTLEMASQTSEVQAGSLDTPYALKGIIDALGLSAESRSALWADIRRHTLGSGESKFLRELSLQELRTLAFVVLTDDDNIPSKLLVFAWRDAAAESAGVASFLSGLSGFLGHLLAPSENVVETKAQ